MKAVFIIQPYGPIIRTEQKAVPSLKQLQDAVGGSIELLPGFTRFEFGGKTYTRGAAFVNENGISMQLPFNKRATEAWKACLGLKPLWYDPHLMGNVIFYATVK